MTEPIPLEIEVAHAKQLVEGPDEVLLVDCRQPHEHEYCRIDGARLIPMRQLPAEVGSLGSWRERPIIVHCHHGKRSLQVVSWLREQGFPYAQSMSGGIDRWSLEIDERVPRY